MSLIYILIGFTLGFAAKIGADKYHEYKTKDEKRSNDLDEILTKWRAMEMNKKI